MTDQPFLISVIIPAFNSASSIERAIRSALDQNVKNIEIIVVDDGSTDTTANLAKTFGPPVVVIHQSNAGSAAARNRGIHSCRGDYVAFLDSDDEWLPGRLEAGLRPMLESTEVGLTFCHAIRRLSGADDIVFGSRLMQEGFLDAEFWPSPLHTTPGTTARRKTLIDAGLFDESLSVWEDVDLWLRIRELTKVVEIPQSLVVVHSTANSLSNTPERDLQSRKDFFRVIEKAIQRDPQLYGIKQRQLMSGGWYFWGRRAFARRESWQALACLWQSFVARPNLRAMTFMARILTPEWFLSILRYCRGRFNLLRESRG